MAHEHTPLRGGVQIASPPPEQLETLDLSSRAGVWVAPSRKALGTATDVHAVYLSSGTRTAGEQRTWAPSNGLLAGTEASSG